MTDEKNCDCGYVQSGHVGTHLAGCPAEKKAREFWLAFVGFDRSMVAFQTYELARAYSPKVDPIFVREVLPHQSSDTAGEVDDVRAFYRDEVEKRQQRIYSLEAEISRIKSDLAETKAYISTVDEAKLASGFAAYSEIQRLKAEVEEKSKFIAKLRDYHNVELERADKFEVELASLRSKPDDGDVRDHRIRVAKDKLEWAKTYRDQYKPHLSWVLIDEALEALRNAGKGK